MKNKVLLIILAIILIGGGVGAFFLFRSPSDDSQGTIKVSITFNGTKFVTYKGNTPYKGLDGVTYTNGDLLPTWVQYQNDLNIMIEDVTPKTGSSDSEIFTQAEAKGFTGADIYNADASGFVKQGILGKFVALDNYWDELPNLKAFLDQNPGYYLSLYADNGHIYYSPYFDGYNEVERMFMMRHDWVKLLLDTDASYDTAKVQETHYSAFTPEVLNTVVKGCTASITKNHNENIITIQNNLDTKNGQSLVNALKSYIDTTYGTQYTKRSDLFLGENAVYDADELIALMRCVKANPELLTGDPNTDIVIFFPREKSRANEVISLAQIFGIRGLSTSDTTLYIGADGNLHDTLSEESTLEALGYLNNLYKEGLIMNNFNVGYGTVEDYRQKLFETGHGFMTFDYVATTTALYTTITQTSSSLTQEQKDNFVFESVLPAVVDWNDGTADNYIHFSDSVRTVKSEGWGIPSHVANDPDKLKLALKFIDYAYSPKGSVLVTYGPSAWIGSGTYNYNDREIPVVHEKAIEEIYSLSNGSTTDYYRTYVGATLNIGYCKDMGMEYQTLNEQGRNSVNRIAKAVSTGALLITTPTEKTNLFFLTPPTTYSLTEEEQEYITVNVTASQVWKEYRVNYIKYGLGATYKIGTANFSTPTITEYMTKLSEKGHNEYMMHYRNAWGRMKLNLVS